MAVHPRGHGEHFEADLRELCGRGSSPWARGTRSSVIVVTFNPRFIPVGTGNTNVSASLKKPLSVHPRGHGEHLSACNPKCPITGSSPWARGTPYRIHPHQVRFRFIPVGTGNTRQQRHTWAAHPVHPRGHGEHTKTALGYASTTGSSPWARGTRQPASHQ